MNDDGLLAGTNCAVNLGHGTRVDELVKHETSSNVQSHHRRRLINFLAHFGRDLLLFVGMQLLGEWER